MSLIMSNSNIIKNSKPYSVIIIKIIKLKNNLRI